MAFKEAFETESREPKDLNEAMAWIFWYFASVPYMTIVRSVYGEEADMSYLQGKIDVIVARGPGAWWGELDLANRRRLAECIKAKYGKLDSAE